MVDEPILDSNDQYLTGVFLREMIRFEKFVRAQGGTAVTERILWAHSKAILEFKRRQELMIGLDDLNLEEETDA